jgi:hypothetical protein
MARNPFDRSLTGLAKNEVGPPLVVGSTAVTDCAIISARGGILRVQSTDCDCFASHNMPQVKLESAFGIRGRGLILIPVLPLATTDRFRPFTARVSLFRPDGTEWEFEARFQVEHFSYVDGRGSWRIVAMLPDASKADVPEGTELKVSANTLALLRGRPRVPEL